MVLQTAGHRHGAIFSWIQLPLSGRFRRAVPDAEYVTFIGADLPHLSDQRWSVAVMRPHWSGRQERA